MKSRENIHHETSKFVSCKY